MAMGADWHPSRADEVVADLEEIEANGSARNPIAVLRSDLSRRRFKEDMRTPSPWVEIAEDDGVRDCTTYHHWLCPEPDVCSCRCHWIGKNK